MKICSLIIQRLDAKKDTVKSYSSICHLTKRCTHWNEPNENDILRDKWHKNLYLKED